MLGVCPISSRKSRNGVYIKAFHKLESGVFEENKVTPKSKVKKKIIVMM